MAAAMIPPKVLAAKQSIWELLFGYYEDGDENMQFNKSTGFSIRGNRVMTIYHGVHLKTKVIKARRMNTKKQRFMEIEHARSSCDLLILKFKKKGYRAPSYLRISPTTNLNVGNVKWLVGNTDHEFGAFVETVTVVSRCRHDNPFDLNSFVKNPVPYPPRSYLLLSDVDPRLNSSPNVPVFKFNPYCIPFGHSGSAVINESGHVIGMLKGVSETSPGVGSRVAIYAPALCVFSEEANLVRKRANQRRSRVVGFSSYARFRRAAMELPL